MMCQCSSYGKNRQFIHLLCFTTIKMLVDYEQLFHLMVSKINPEKV